MSTSTALVPQKDLSLAYVLWIGGFLGFAGLHRMYMGRWVSGFIWLATGGLCLVGQIVDLVMMSRMLADSNEGKPGF